MRSDSVIPHDHSPRRPLNSALQILTKRDVVIQELEQVLALLLLEADDVARELRVDIDGLFACDGVSPDYGMDAAHWVAADDAAFLEGSLGLLVAGVDGFEAEEAFAEGGAETLVRFGLVHEEGVTSCLGHVQSIQEGSPWRLLLVSDITVPCNGVCAVVEELSSRLVVRATMNEMDFGEASRSTRSGMNVQTAEVFPELEGFLDWERSEVLVTEGDDLLLCDEEGELVLAGVGERAELRSPYFCADG